MQETDTIFNIYPQAVTLNETLIKDTIAQDSIVQLLENSNNMSIFIDHSLAVKSMDLLPIAQNNTNIFLYWLIGVSAIIAIGKFSYYKHFILSITGSFSNRNFSQLQQLGATIRHPLNLILFLAYIIVTGLFISIISYDYVDLNIYTTNSLIIYNTIIVLLLFTFSYILSRIFHYIFELDTLIQGYYARIIQSNNIVAVAISIGLWLTIFTGIQTGTVIIYSLLAILYFLRIYNLLIFNSTKNKYGLLHYIIYICTVEILPFIIAVKLYFIKVLQL